MARLILLYFIGIFFTWFALSRFPLFAIPNLFDISLAIVQSNDYIKYTVRLLFAFTFGFFYINIKMKQNGHTGFSKRTIIGNIISIAAMVITIFCEVSYQHFIDQKQTIYFSSLLKLWIVFPLQIISISILRKYGFRSQHVKWL